MVLLESGFFFFAFSFFSSLLFYTRFSGLLLVILVFSSDVRGVAKRRVILTCTFFAVSFCTSALGILYAFSVKLTFLLFC